MYVWEHRNDVEYAGTVDRDDTKCWAGNIGVVTTLFERVKVSPDNTYALVCGPPVMYRFVLRDLQKLGFQDDRMYFEPVSIVFDLEVDYLLHACLNSLHPCA